MFLSNFFQVSCFRVLHCLLITSALTFALEEDVPPEPKYVIKSALQESIVAKYLSLLARLQNPWEVGDLFESDIMVPEDDGDRNGLEDEAKRWPNATIVYYIDRKYFSPLQQQRIKVAMTEIEKKTCVRFRPYKKGDRAFLRVRGSDYKGCASFMGRLSGGQELNLEPPHCLQGHGTVLHELLHALGFAHQHSAPDRDKYIRIIWDNIEEGRRRNFDIQDDLTDFGVGYDYASIMHYSDHAGTKNKKPTIEPLDKTAKIGQRLGLSPKDAEKIRRMYGCVQKKKKVLKKSKIRLQKLRTAIRKITRPNDR